MLVLGLTGEVGAGKSTVLAWFAARGDWTLSADRLVDELWARPEMTAEAARLWGDDVAPGGVLNRRLLASRAFASPEEQRKLCALVHPVVRAETERRLPGRGLAVVEIPLLFESGVPWWCEGVLFVRASLAARSSRNVARGLDEAELRRRGRFFWSSDRRAAASDWVLDNDGTQSRMAQRLAELRVELASLDRLAQLDWVGGLDEATALQEQRLVAGLSATADSAAPGRFVCRAFCLVDRVSELTLERLTVRRDFTLSCRWRQGVLADLAG